MMAIISTLLTLSSHTIAALYIAPLRLSFRYSLCLWLCYDCLTVLFWTWSLSTLPHPYGSVAAFSVSYLVHHLLFFILTSGSLGKRCFLLVNYDILFMLCAGLNYIFRFTILTSDHPGTSMVYALALFVMLFLYIKRFIPLVNTSSSKLKSGWRPLCLISLLCLIIVLSQIIYPFDFIELTPAKVFVFILIAILVILIYPVFFTYLSGLTLASQVRETQLHLNLLHEQVKSQQAITEAARRSRHDMRHHNLALTVYAKRGDMQGLLNYLGQYEKLENAAYPQRYCENNFLNNLLTVYARQAHKAHIHLELTALAENRLPVTEPDLVAMVANVFENAIQGASSADASAPFIKMRVLHKAQKLIISCENSCQESLAYADGFPTENYGTGLNSIITAATHYDGDWTFSAENDIFTTRILLTLAN